MRVHKPPKSCPSLGQNVMVKNHYTTRWLPLPQIRHLSYWSLISIILSVSFFPSISLSSHLFSSPSPLLSSPFTFPFLLQIMQFFPWMLTLKSSVSGKFLVHMIWFWGKNNTCCLWVFPFPVKISCLIASLRLHLVHLFASKTFPSAPNIRFRLASRCFLHPSIRLLVPVHSKFSVL